MVKIGEKMSDIVITSVGNALDMEALRLKNEETIAVGNMKVNARGDELDAKTGKVSRSRADRMKDYYRLHTPIPRDLPMVPLEAPSPVNVIESKIQVEQVVKNEPKVEVKPVTKVKE